MLSATEDGRAALKLLEGPLAGRTVDGVYYLLLGEAPPPGAEVVANTVGLEMGLGTGGIAVVCPSAGSASVPENRDHFVKLPYTPLQFAVPAPAQARDLAGIPVAVLPLHSHLAPACCAAAALKPGARVDFVWQEGAALPIAFSDTVRELRDRALLRRVVSVGNAFGGDIEAPNVYAGLLAAAAEGGPPADLVLAGIGPGIVGTAADYGHGGMAAATALNAACALLAEPVLAPRLSDADPRDRHRGLSHHTRATLRAALAACRVAFPADTEPHVRGLPPRHAYEGVSASAAGLEERFGVTFESMGRGYQDDPIFFDAAVAAVRLALGETNR